MVSKTVNSKILIVEKNKHLTKVLEACIDMPRLDIVHKSQLKNEVEHILNNHYTLMIIDINLTDENNIDAIKEIKERAVVLPIIAIGPNCQNLAIVAYESGINIYHFKPLQCKLLRAQILQLLSSSNKEIIFEIGKIQVNISAQSFYIHNQKIEFTYQEFRLILLLLKAEGRVVNRNSISKCFYDSHNDLSYAAIDTIVSRVRAKLKKHLKKPFILTIYKLGYRINPIYFKKYHIKTNHF